jgi:hypothetical protein
VREKKILEHTQGHHGQRPKVNLTGALEIALVVELLDVSLVG